MRLAVVQHAFRSDAEADADALLMACAGAAAQGAELVVAPEVPTAHGALALDSWWQRIAASVPDSRVMVPLMAIAPGPPEYDVCVEGFGNVVVLVGDVIADAEVLSTLPGRGDAIVIAPHSESDLQAEAALELAIGLSVSAASLVLIAETDGAPPGEAGHGGSAIVYLGEVVAEAMHGDDILLADIDVPLSPPEPVGPLPEIAPILVQRSATHRGEKPTVPYLADLS